MQKLLLLIILFACNINLFSQEIIEPETLSDDIYILVEEMPKFQNGDHNNFRTYIQNNLKYPTIAAENGISGKVFVQFVIDTTGSVVNAKIVRGVHPSLDAESLRVVRSSPKWEPGRQRGEKVAVQFTFPIVYMLQGNSFRLFPWRRSVD